uniref:Fe2OG dioxygenase domain-containing protein n=2 Tax=Coccolithus braarudii TaxID=221442 RepID=A0A7S0LLG9_9EUKA
MPPWWRSQQPTCCAFARAPLWLACCALRQVRPSTGTPDQKESLQVTARASAMDARWPTEPANFERTARSLLIEAHAFAARLLSLLERRACPQVAEGTLTGAHTLWSEGGQCTLRLLHYPPTEAHDPTVNADASRMWRAGPHTDWDCLTLLFQRLGEGGLECASNPNAPGGIEGGWVAVEPVEGGIAVNIGDMLSRWSDGRLYSNLHRVRLPTPAECSPSPRSRYSIAFFMQADKPVLIESEKHEPITAGDYILHRIASNF